MNVEELMTKSVKSCGPEDSLEAAARLMWENDCGCVPITDEQGRPLAMLTDRDVCMAALTQGRTLGEIRVNSAMSGSLHVARVRDPLSEAERQMQEFQVRRLPVVGVDGRLVGVLSMNDIAREAARERPQRQRAVTSDDVAATLASICRPRVCLIDGEGQTPAQPIAARLVKSGAAAV
jgi:CBS domain-containing protein